MCISHVITNNQWDRGDGELKKGVKRSWGEGAWEGEWWPKGAGWVGVESKFEGESEEVLGREVRKGGVERREGGKGKEGVEEREGG